MNIEQFRKKYHLTKQNFCNKIKMLGQNYKQNFSDDKKWVVQVDGRKFKVLKVVYVGKLDKED